MNTDRIAGIAMNPRFRNADRSPMLILMTTVILLFAGSCGTLGTGCDADLSIVLTPESITLSVGQSFDPAVRIYGCGGKQELTDQITWRAENTLVLQVDAATGHSTALQVGATLLRPVGQKYGVLSAVAVTVH